jgi:hypothetical protein
MNRIKTLACVLIVAGVLSLMYHGFTYTKESHDLRVGSLELSVKDKETISIPVWCSVGAIAVGLIVLLAGTGRAVDALAVRSRGARSADR